MINFISWLISSSSLSQYHVMILVVFFVISYLLIENKLLIRTDQVIADVVETQKEKILQTSNPESTKTLEDNPFGDVTTADGSNQLISKRHQQSNQIESSIDRDPDQSTRPIIQSVRSTMEPTHEKNDNTRDVEIFYGNSIQQDYFLEHLIDSLHFQVIFIGDSGVGKTSFMGQYCKSSFHERMPSTLCIDLMTKKTRVDSIPVVLHLWDTAGQERFKSVSVQYMRKTDCVIAMFDVTREQSLINIEEWLTFVKNTLADLDKIPIGVVANKSDLLYKKISPEMRTDSRCIPGRGDDNDAETDYGGGDDDDDHGGDDDDLSHYICLMEGRLLAQKLRAAFGVCSSKTGSGISKFMETVCRMLVTKWKITSNNPHHDDKSHMQNKRKHMKLRSLQCC